jgi:hypothetical protein
MSAIIKSIMKDYAKLQFKTEHMVYSMMLTGKVAPIDINNLNLAEIIRSIHEANLVGVSFEEGEFILNDKYEVHSISGSRDEDGDPMVFINMYDIEENESHSVRWHEFPHIADMFQILEKVDEKCSFKYKD